MPNALKSSAGLSRRARKLPAAGPLVAGGALGLALCFAAMPSSATEGPQSFSDSLVSTVLTACGLGSVGADLALVCAGPVGAAAAPPGTPAASSDLGGQDPESRVEQRMKERRKGEGGATGMNGASGSDMSFSLMGLSGFASFGYENVDKNTTALDPGYKSDQYGGTIGVDKRVGPIIAGVAFNFSRTDGDFAGSGSGGFDTDSYGGLIYASIVPIESAYLDLSAGYARKDYSTTRAAGLAVVTSTVSGNTDGDEYRASVSGGYDFTHQNFTFGPRVSVNYVRNHVDAFSETGGTGLEIAFDEHATTSMTFSAGVHGSAAFSTSFGVLVPQVSFDYIHEAQNGQETLTGHLVQDLTLTQLAFQTDNPDRDYYGVGVGLVAVLPNGLSPFVSYRGIFGDSLRSVHGVTVGIRKEF
jgi:uncharacterized protein with beta-barrel porin domain